MNDFFRKIKISKIDKELYYFQIEIEKDPSLKEHYNTEINNLKTKRKNLVNQLNPRRKRKYQL